MPAVTNEERDVFTPDHTGIKNSVENFMPPFMSESGSVMDAGDGQINRAGTHHDQSTKKSLASPSKRTNGSHQ